MLIQRKIEKVMTWVGGVEKQIRPAQNVIFDYGDWTTSNWIATPNSGTVSKYTDRITFYNGGHCQMSLSPYIIDGTKDFLLEFNANIPNTTVSYHRVGLSKISDNTELVSFQTNWESAYRNKIWCNVGGTRYSGETNGTKSFFIKKEGSVLTMGRDGVVKYTNNNYSFENQYYFTEKVYQSTLTIYTAKLTYL